MVAEPKSEPNLYIRSFQVATDGSIWLRHKGTRVAFEALDPFLVAHHENFIPTTFNVGAWVADGLRSIATKGSRIDARHGGTYDPAFICRDCGKGFTREQSHSVAGLPGFCKPCADKRLDGYEAKTPERSDLDEGTSIMPDAKELASLTGHRVVELWEGNPWANNSPNDEMVAVLVVRGEPKVLRLGREVLSEKVEPSLPPGRKRAQQVRSLIIRKAKEL